MKTATLGFLLCCCLPAQLRINAGGPAFTDGVGRVWAADTGFAGGSAATDGTAPKGSIAAYSSRRYGTSFSYAFPVPDGRYTVSLYLIEQAWLLGPRIFSVTINGTVALSNYNLSVDAGNNVPARKTFPVTAAAGSGIKLVFTAVQRQALVNAIEILPAPDRLNVFPVTFDGAGVPLSGSATSCTYVAEGGILSGVRMTAEPGRGTATVELLAESYAEYRINGAAGALPLTGSGSVLQMTDVPAETPSLAGYKTTIPADTMLCFKLTDPGIAIRLHVFALLQPLTAAARWCSVGFLENGVCRVFPFAARVQVVRPWSVELRPVANDPAHRFTETIVPGLAVVPIAAVGCCLS